MEEVNRIPNRKDPKLSSSVSIVERSRIADRNPMGLKVSSIEWEWKKREVVDEGLREKERLNAEVG